MVGLERPQGQPRIFTHPANTNPPSMFDPDITVESDDVEQEVQMEDGDRCCSDAKDKLCQWWAEKNNMSPSQHQRLRTNLDATPCDIFREMIETIPGTGPGTDMAEHQRTLDKYRQIADEWDACASESFGGMFTASADALEEGWGAIQKNKPINPLNAGGQRLVENYQPNEFLAQYAGEMPVEADMGGDACCIDAKNKWIEGLREIFGDDYSAPHHAEEIFQEVAPFHQVEVIAASAHPRSPNGEIYRSYEEMSCEEFRDAIEQFAGGRPGPFYNANVGNRRNPTSEHYLAKRILEEWDRCEAQSTFGDNLDIYASEDAFDAGWNAIQKQIGRDDFTYSMYLQPSLLTDAGPLQRDIPMQLGMYSVGSLPLNTAVQHLEQLEEDPTGFATQLGYETPESVGLRRDDYDDDYEWWEALAEHGIASSPEEHLEHEGVSLYDVEQLLDVFANQAGRMPMADEFRYNIEDKSYYWPQMLQHGGGIGRYLQWADQRRDEGRNTMPVSSGSISALGQGPMIDVNPLFRGMGLGLNTMGTLLENTGRIEEAVASPAGLGAFRAMDAGLREMGIDPNTKMNVRNLMEDENERAQNWRYHRDSRYPVRGEMSMSVPEGTQINPVLPNTARILLGTREMNEQGLEPLTLEEMRNLIDITQEEIPRRQLGQTLAPPSLRRQPYRQPRFLDEDNFRVEGLWG